MGILISKPKLNAAARSMHQFCAVVRSIFICPVADEVVEAATVFLYEHVAREVFGKRFAAEIRREARLHYRAGAPMAIETRVERLGRHTEVFRRRAENAASAGSAHDEYTRHVQTVICALLVEAGAPHDDPELIKGTFPKFEDAIRRLKAHLVGIKRQSRYIMR
jgi:hypothetical protein